MADTVVLKNQYNSCLKKVLTWIFVFLFLFDTSYTFWQEYNMPLDGDMAGGIVPHKSVKPILEHPLGLNVLLHHDSYPNPNRFFSHWSFFEYFNHVPLFLQSFTSPINSVYLSTAIAKTGMKILLLFLLAYFIARKGFDFNFWLATVLVFPLFQTYGYSNFIGLISASPTYSFFYAFPLILLLLYFLPLFMQYFHHKTWKSIKWLKFLWIPLAIIVSLSGPLNTGMALILGVLILFLFVYKNWHSYPEDSSSKRFRYTFTNIPSNIWFYTIPITLFSLYSLYIGSFSYLNIDNQIPLYVMYSRIPLGLYNLFSQKIGPILLVILLIFNYYWIKKKTDKDVFSKVARSFLWVSIFSIIYIILLPLGGYRSYRPNIIRFDTFIPITFGLFFLWGYSTLHLLKTLDQRGKRWFLPVVIIFLGIFMLADQPHFNANECERKALNKIAHFNKDIVPISSDCTVISWNKITNPENSKLNAILLNRWNITDSIKLYYHPKK